MHTRGRPDQWRTQPQLDPDSLIETVRSGLAASLSTAANAGIPPDHIVLDPGYGFGKRLNENFSLLSRQSRLSALSDAPFSPDSAANPSSATRSRRSTTANPLLSARAKPPPSLPSSLPSFTEHPSSAPTTSAPPSKPPASPMPSSPRTDFQVALRRLGDEASSTSVIRSNPPPGRVPPGSGSETRERSAGPSFLPHRPPRAPSKAPLGWENHEPHPRTQPPVVLFSPPPQRIVILRTRAPWAPNRARCDWG